MLLIPKRINVRWKRIRSPRAFTIIELLVVVAVIGLLIALLLPAVQSVRESARRLSCSNHLSQLGIALQNYESVHNMFPPGGLDDPKISPRTLTIEISGFVYVLPYLEQQPLYSSYNFDWAIVDGPESPIMENQTVRATKLAVLLCPSDGEPNHLNSYRFNQGRYNERPGHAFDGPFGFSVSTRSAAITDGLAKTAFVSEGLGGTFNAMKSGWPRDVKYIGSDAGLGPFNSDSEYIPSCLNYPEPSWKTVSGRYWTYLGFTNSAYNHQGTPNDLRPSCGGSGLGQYDAGLYPPRSYHPGLVHVLMGDGHVEAITDTIQPRVWIALGTPDAGDF